MKIRERVRRYLQVAEQFTENIMERVRIARMAGVNVNEALQKLGIENATAFREEFVKRIQEDRQDCDSSHHEAAPREDSARTIR